MENKKIKQMAWSEEQISTYQIHNNKMLEEINATLPGLTGKPIVGIFCPGQNGDTMVTSSILKYKNEIWPEKDVVWFCNQPVCDVLKYSKEVNQIRPWPWANNGLPDGCPDFWPMLMNESDNQLNQNLKYNFNLTKDLTDGYFPCPYMLEPSKRHGIEYSNCSKKIFGIQNDYPWHPVLYFSDLEKREAIDFMKELEDGKKILIETFAGSSQSILSEDMVMDAIKLCREKWSGCTFIFASHKFLRTQEKFPDDFFKGDITSADEFTVRQCALIAEQCDLMISVSSGITVAASAWGLKPPPCLQYCGSKICGTKAIYSGDMIQVFADNKSKESAELEFINQLDFLLNKYK